MDESGLKSHGKSASLAELKTNPQNKGVPPPLPDFLVVGGLDDIFNTTHKKESSGSSGSTQIPNMGLDMEWLFPGFGISRCTPAYDRKSDVKVTQPSSSPADDPFSVPEPPAYSSWPFSESFWSQPNRENVPVQKKEPVFGGSFPWGQKPASSTSVPKDFVSLFEEFEADDVYKSGASKDRDGESAEQRRRGRRSNSHMRTQERMANALAEKKQRDMQILQEQEERSRLADTLDNKIKRWASGKVGDVRALLSSLQDVLWPENGWQMTSSTDLKESKSVKKVYNRAMKYLHPDKAKQNGFSLEEKYIAEKVFYVLKEAYKAFQTKELR